MYYITTTIISNIIYMYIIEKKEYEFTKVLIEFEEEDNKYYVL